MANNRSKQSAIFPSQKLDALTRSNTLAFYTHQSANLVKRLGCSLMNFFTGSSDLIITQYAQGNIQTWQVYDSLTDQTLYFEQEETLRSWIDQHYNQQ